MENTTPTTKITSLEEADDLVMNSIYETLLDGYSEELEGEGWVYGLDNGLSVTVTYEGDLLLNHDH